MFPSLRIAALAGFLGAAACVHQKPEPPAQPIPVEALTDANSIRLRCERPEEVIAGRAFCVLNDRLPTPPNQP